MGWVHQKLWRLQHNLRCWSNSRIGDLPKKAAEAHGSLDSLLQQDQDPGLPNVPIGRIRAATNKLTALECQLEIFWAQRSRAKWIVEGDQNTRYFQAKVHWRRAHNRIERIRSMNGSMITNPEDIRQLVLSHFTNHWQSKIENPLNLPPDLFDKKEFRPISICDTKYKILAKILVRRLEMVLPSIIGMEQGAFVPHRSIHGHLLLVQDILHSLRSRKGRHRGKLMGTKVFEAVNHRLATWKSQLLSMAGRQAYRLLWLAIVNEWREISSGIKEDMVGLYIILVGIQLFSLKQWVDWDYAAERYAESHSCNFGLQIPSSPITCVVVSRVLALGKECVQLLSSKKKNLQEANSVLFSNHGPITFPKYNTPIRNSKYSYVITDGSVDGTTRVAGAAFVLVQNSPFQVMGVGYMYWPWAHPLRMETEAIRLGIQQARALGLNHIRVWSDSTRVIQLLQGSGIGPSSISLLVEAIRAANLHTDHIQFVKVPRAYVMGPDILAKFARKQRKSGYSMYLQEEWIRKLLSPIFPSLIQCIAYVKAQLLLPHMSM
ncbi:hypothetical protein QJS04_geneDACA010953 [Acorus gramineus]|uniref:RNase H type-1 domain-containing protein n=1 Tax=Acorus gramineus TaxID=55184 RepID=A0AAV9BHI4_ACOGR|nr:hypothetical protein QJS04_geneDACA010953 [Acorus gramineus]